MLRKDCIKGLGVPLLHRAYELLDENNEDELEVSWTEEQRVSLITTDLSLNFGVLAIAETSHWSSGRSAVQPMGGKDLAT